MRFVDDIHGKPVRQPYYCLSELILFVKEIGLHLHFGIRSKGDQAFIREQDFEPAFARGAKFVFSVYDLMEPGFFPFPKRNPLNLARIVQDKVLNFKGLNTKTPE